MHNSKDSVLGKCSEGIFEYLESYPGNLSSVSSKAGGGILKALLQILTYSSPCSAAVSALFNPYKAP